MTFWLQKCWYIQKNHNVYHLNYMCSCQINCQPQTKLRSFSFCWCEIKWNVSTIFSFILHRLTGGQSCWLSWLCLEWWAAPSASAAALWTPVTWSDFWVFHPCYLLEYKRGLLMTHNNSFFSGILECPNPIHKMFFIPSVLRQMTVKTLTPAPHGS